MIAKIKYFLTIMDLPSGVVLGIHTLTMIALSIAAFILKRAVDPTITTIYGIVLGAFAVHKTTTATTTIVQQGSQNAANQGSDSNANPPN